MKFSDRELDLWIAINVMDIDPTAISLAKSEIKPYTSSMKCAFDVRRKMTEKGYSSHDRYTDMGWGVDSNNHKIYGYNIWFEMWPRDVDGKILGYKLIGLGLQSDPTKFAYAVCLAAKKAIIDPQRG